MSAQTIEPYDPESPAGREIAANLTRLLDDIEPAVMRRRAARLAAESATASSAPEQVVEAA